MLRRKPQPGMNVLSHATPDVPPHTVIVVAAGVELNTAGVSLAPPLMVLLATTTEIGCEVAPGTAVVDTSPVLLPGRT